ncbi:SAM-dependent methyltransferase [Merismopedia glauca]|uniref:Methyltransferase n=1 Tax=Merismopedia glauca CCAP 1448/3 TaxID=1296344 RepID=A0A2T1C540_9CYAN|nr:SAM-dependent methyltransferase [Merismopedia glauca]PSB03278.1 methyltransferase [Merismopedia glauca CCAP 1448/3]
MSNSQPANSLPPSYFDQIYQKEPDPWKFATSDYEANKYQATIAALNRDKYRSGLEIGGSIGILTEKLAARCESILSLEVSALAQSQAIARCQHLPHVRFQILQVPQEYPLEKFDLVVLSEVGYYWCLEDLKQARQLILDSLEPGGQILLVHWLPFTPDYPLTGDLVHDTFLELVPHQVKHLLSQREEKYRLDLLEKQG